MVFLKEKKMDRKLATIMFTDLVDFTGLMSRDETNALQMLNHKIAIVKKNINKFDGKFVKDIGDGTLSYFYSASEAVECAIQIQSILKDEIKVRIGLHMGEVIHKDNDILGDTVNVASRIEKISCPGGICISSNIYDQLRNKNKFNFKHLGLHSFKGVGRLLDVYGIQSSKSNIVKLKNAEIINQYESNELPTLAIVPFRNKGDENDNFYAYSLSLEIFAKISISSNIILSSMEEIEILLSSKKSKQILQTLNVRYSLSGSLWKKNDIFILSAELFDGKNNKIVWADSWRENWNSLPVLEKKISNNVVKVLDNESIEKVEAHQRTTREENIENKVVITNSEAYRIYLKGKYIYHNRTSDRDILKSESLFKKSIKLDLALIQPRMLLGEIYYNRADYDKCLEMYENNLEMSLEYNDSKNISSSLSSIASVYFQKGEYDKCLEFNLQALKIRQKINNKKGIASSYNSIGAIHQVLKEFDKALENYEKSLLIAREIHDERSMTMGTLNIANLHNSMGDLKKALEMQKKCLILCKKNKKQPWLAYAYNLAGVIFSNMHKYDESIFNLKKCLKIRRNLNEPLGVAGVFKSIAIIYYYKGQYKQAMTYHNKSLKERQKIGEKAGIGESLSMIGDTYKKMGDYDKAINAYEKSYEIMKYIKDYEHASKILNALGNVYRKKGEYAIAIRTLKKANKIKSKIRDHAFLGYTFLEFSSIYRWQGEYELALEYSEKSIEIAKKYEQHKLLANNLYHKSLMSINVNDYENAKKNIDEAIKIAQEHDYLSNLAKYLDCLGIILRYEKDYEYALKAINESLSISRKIKDIHGERKYLNSLGLVKEQTGNYVKALDLYLDCLQLSKKMNEKRSISVSYNNIGCIYECLNDWELANKNFKKALSYAKRIDYKEGIAAFQFNIAFIYGKLKKYDKAFQFIEGSIEAHRKINSSHPFILSCNIYKTFLYVIIGDVKLVKSNFKKLTIKKTNNDFGYERNWELHKIYNFLGKNSMFFLNNAYLELLDSINSISSKTDKNYFIDNVGYNKKIISGWESNNKSS
tara:strand:+ start:1221 stop:4349 length:3129 start_codon:yes stop_codon:yes gene_type:complete